MSIVGRRKLDHPALGTAGGSALYASIENIYTVISNDDAGRYFTFAALANSGTLTFDHNFGVPLSELKPMLYTGTFPTLTPILDPVAAGWTITATTGNTSTKIDLIAPSSGGPFTGVIFIVHDRSITATTAAADGQFLIYDSASGKFVNSNVRFISEAATISANTITPSTTRTTQRITGTASDLQMIAQPTADQFRILVNETGSIVTIKNDTGATAANRFYTGTGADFMLQPQASVGALYDSALLRWVLFGASSGSGSGSGEKNYLTTGTDSAAGWVASGAGITVTTDTTPANFPANATESTALKITRVSGADYVYKRFTLDAVDYGVKLKSIKDYKYAGVQGDYTFRVFQNTNSTYTGTSTEVPVSPSTAIPAGTGQARMAFDTSGASPYIEIRIYGNSGTTPLYLNNFLVGPGIVGQTVPNTDWLAYSPLTVYTTNAVNTGFWKRQGSDVNLRVNTVFTGANTQGAHSSLISGLLNGLGITLDSNKLGAANTRVSIGTWAGLGPGNGAYSGLINANPAGGYEVSYPTGANSAVNVNTAANQPFTVASGNNFSLTITLPILEWANANVYVGAGAQPNYSSNSSTSTASDSTSFQSGEDGAALQAFAPTGTSVVTKRVRCPYPNPKFAVLQIKYQNRNWEDLGSSELGFKTNDAGTTLYGMLMNPVTGSTTDFDVSFASAPYPGSAWTNFSSAGSRWRVVFADTPAAVGFGLADSNDSGLVSPLGASGTVLKGGTNSGGTWAQVTNNDISPTAAIDGTKIVSATSAIRGTVLGGAVPGNAGAVAIAYPFAGYNITVNATGTAADVNAGVYTNVTGLSFTLQPGTYDIEVGLPMHIFGGDATSAANARIAFAQIWNSTDSVALRETLGPLTWGNGTVPGSATIGTSTVTFSVRESFTVAKTFVCRVTSKQAGGTSAIQSLTGGYFNIGYMRATLR